jgi:hypothetical protein
MIKKSFNKKWLLIPIILIAAVLANTFLPAKNGVRENIADIPHKIFTVGSSLFSPEAVYGSTTYDYTNLPAALAALPSAGGEIVFVGTQTLTATLSRAIDNVIITGAGASSVINYNGSTPVISFGSQKGWIIRDCKTDAGGITTTSATYWTMERVWVGSTYYSLRMSGDINYPTGRATYTIAAANSPAIIKSQADLICTGTISTGGDQTKINAALISYKSVTLTEGTFYLNGSIVPIDFSTLLGSGILATRLYVINGSSTTAIINAGSSSARVHIELGAFSLDCNSSGNPSGYHGIQLRSTFRSSIHDILIQNAPQRGIYIQATAPLLNSAELLARDITVYGSGKEGFRSDGSSDMNVDNLYVGTTGSGYDGIMFNGNGGDDYRNMHVLDAGRYGMYFSAGCANFHLSKGGVDIGCQLDGIYSLSNNSTFDDIYIVGGSTSIPNTYDGFVVGGSYNIITRVSTSRFGATYQRYGISEIGSADYNIYENNLLDNNLTGSMSLIGSHNLVSPSGGGTLATTANITSDINTHAANTLLHNQVPYSVQPVGGYADFAFTTGSSNLTLGANYLYARPIFVPRNMSFDRIAVYVSGDAAGGSLIRLGIYNVDSTGAPSALVVDAGTVACDATGLKYITLSPVVTLAPGWYWTAYTSNGAPTLNIRTGFGCPGGISTSDFKSILAAYYKAASYDAFPNPWPGGTTGQTTAGYVTEIVFLRIYSLN